MTGIKVLNIYLLSLVILFGSILNVHAHHDELGNSETETSKEIEKASGQDQEYLTNYNFINFDSYLDIIDSKFSLPSDLAHSHNCFTTFRLLKSHRIALPPPTIS